MSRLVETKSLFARSGTGTGWIWAVLVIATTAPFPFKGIAHPEHSTPILFIAVAAGIVLSVQVGRATVGPLGILLAYAMGHVLVGGILSGGIAVRGAQLLALIGLAALLAVAATHLSMDNSRRVGIALVISAGVQAALGGLNIAFEVYPTSLLLTKPLHWLGLGWVATMIVGEMVYTPPVITSGEFVGKALGWIGHPNYWGSYLALALPFVMKASWWAVVPAVIVILCSRSLGAALAVAAALVVGAWRIKRERLAGPRCAVSAASMAVIGMIVVAAAFALRTIARPEVPMDLEHFTAGRSTIWAAAMPYIQSAWFFGNGLGSWWMWALAFNDAQSKIGGIEVTLQAHNEYIQILFELGAVGLLLILAAMFGLVRKARLVIDTDDWPWVAVLAAVSVNALVSTPWHLPAHAVVAVFAVARICAARGPTP